MEFHAFFDPFFSSKMGVGVNPSGPEIAATCVHSLKAFNFKTLASKLSQVFPLTFARCWHSCVRQGAFSFTQGGAVLLKSDHVENHPQG